MRQKDLVSISDLTRDDVCRIFELSRRLKRDRREGKSHEWLSKKVLALVFEKPSNRTRVTFEVGMYQLGGHGVYLAAQDILMGERESIPDIARNLSCWVNAIAARTFAHSTVVELAEHASVPVINALSDLEHPCQALTDLFTMEEKFGDVSGRRLAFIGDGNNMANSLMLLCPMLGVDFVIACPDGYEPLPQFWNAAREAAAHLGTEVIRFERPEKAVEGADVIYTDVWTSMGQEAEAEQRRKVFASYQVNKRLLALAKDDAIVMHCLPAHRGEEITADVIDGKQSVVYDESENRLHVQKALLILLIDEESIRTPSLETA